MHKSILVGMLAASTILSACSSGTSSQPRGGGNSDDDIVLAKNAGNAAQALTDGATLRASGRASSQLVRDYDAETGVLAADSSVQIMQNDVGGLDLVMGDRTIRFTGAMLSDDGNGFELPDGSASIWAWSADTMAEALDPANGQYSLVFDYYVDTEDGTAGNTGFAVIGTETAPADLRDNPTATYEGWSRVRMAPEEGFGDWSSQMVEAQGDVTLLADFGAGVVSGNIDNLEGRAPRDEDPTRTWTPFDGSLVLEEADIQGNGFTGGISGDETFNTNIGVIDDGSTYSGTFFGPDGEEVGGGINLTGTAADGGAGYVGWGVWQAWVQD